jgi:hypothetical protein
MPRSVDVQRTGEWGRVSGAGEGVSTGLALVSAQACGRGAAATMVMSGATGVSSAEACSDGDLR